MMRCVHEPENGLEAGGACALAAELAHSALTQLNFSGTFSF